MASLFVRDLHENVTESMLYRKFASIGPLLSLRICRDAVSNRSLGYAYVNYSDQIHANRAIETMNFETIEGKSIQVVRSERDPSLRKINQANVFVKNLDKSVTNRELFLAFSQFGHVVSAKVAKDKHGESKCYGFVQFQDDDSVMRTIFTLNGSMVKNKILCVQRFVKNVNGAQSNDKTKRKFTNIYVKNISKDLNDQGLCEMFEKFGKVVSPKIMTDSNGMSRGFGFVSFENSDAASNAITAMNGQIISSGRPLYVCRAQKKNEREIEMKRQHREFGNGTGGSICVSNLDDTIDDNRLREEFQLYGNVITARVIMKQERSIGIGYVCFADVNDSVKAIAAMNGRIIGTKPIVVYSTDSTRSSLGQKRLSDLRSSYRPNWLGIANSTLEANGIPNSDKPDASMRVNEKRKPDMATVFRMLSPPDIPQTPLLIFESISKNSS